MSKVALVTGGTRGIGLAISRALARQGCRVSVIARNVPKDISLEGISFLQADVTGVVQGPPFTVCRSVDILVNNVGGGGRWGSSFLATPTETYEEVYRKNAGAMVKFTSWCVPHMVKANWGRVVTISSIHGKEAGGRPWFNMAKSAEISFMKSLSQDKFLARRNITFNTVCPGHISVDGKPDETPEVLQEFPLGRMGKPEEVASVVAFLCSEEASLVNGACITVDGGESRSF